MKDDTFSMVLSCIMLSEGWDRTLSRRSTRKPHQASPTGGDMQIRAKNVFLLLGVLYGGRMQAV